jgi:hypothetical protein
MRMVSVVLCMGVIISVAHAQTDWPVYGHDPGGMRYSPLKQINTSRHLASRYCQRPHTRLSSRRSSYFMDLSSCF